MNAIDLFIIYLACGAPFGVYYFFQNRSSAKSKLLWFKTLLNFFFWLLPAFRLLRQNKNFRRVFGTDKSLPENSERQINLHSCGKQIEKIFLAGNLETSVYEFREVIERYIGLTIAAQQDAAQISGAENEFFRAASRTQNVESGARCLTRRNRKRLVLHQTEARKDFLHLINQLFGFDSDVKKLEQSAIEFVLILRDPEAQVELEEMFARSVQTADRLSVHQTEKDLWKTETPKPSPVKQLSYRLSPAKATLNLRRKD